VGTPLNMAPEILNGSQYSDKADVWSLGVMLYLLLTNKRPFKSEDLDVLKESYVNGAY
jgi:serine/threonine protein kinase|tara:strand:- start:555 stop:728 length:174 start_codon:yes stop_codon:yes gene_type:complete